MFYVCEQQSLESTETFVISILLLLSTFHFAENVLPLQLSKEVINQEGGKGVNESRRRRDAGHGGASVRGKQELFVRGNKKILCMWKKADLCTTWKVIYCHYMEKSPCLHNVENK